jgi:hypothetical protein
MNRRFWLGNLKERQALGRLSRKWKYNLNFILNNYDVIERS